jgi:hypothetical protein
MAGVPCRLSRPAGRFSPDDDETEEPMTHDAITPRSYRMTVLAAAGALLIATTAVAEAGDDVLLASAKPHGTSLADMAEITAYFNTGPRIPGTQPDTPFQILFSPVDGPTPIFTVHPGTMFYVPIFYSDDSPPILGDLPNDVTDQSAVANYLFSPEELGAVSITIEVDGQVTSLGPDYAAGALTPLADGGMRYTTVAAFLNPLPKGFHTVTIHAMLDGAALDAFPDVFPGGTFEFDTTYHVVVK